MPGARRLVERAQTTLGDGLGKRRSSSNTAQKQVRLTNPGAFTFAPASMSIRTHSSCPLRAAHQSAVLPSSVASSVLFPCPIASRRASTSPAFAAVNKISAFAASWLHVGECSCGTMLDGRVAEVSVAEAIRRDPESSSHKQPKAGTYAE